MSVDVHLVGHLVVIRSLAAELGALELRMQLLRERFYVALREGAAAGATQEELGEAAGVSRQRVGQLVDPEGWKEAQRRAKAKREAQS